LQKEKYAKRNRKGTHTKNRLFSYSLEKEKVCKKEIKRYKYNKNHIKSKTK
jgi:hypothetical protein